MQHLQSFNPQLALALGKLNEKELRLAGRKWQKEAQAEQKVLEALHNTVEEAPLEKIFPPPKVQDAQILLKISPEQARQSEAALNGAK